jgi:trimethylamine--corrinoid protein Co-methyltransferase
VVSDSGAEAAMPHEVKGDVGGLCTMAWDMDLERARPATCDDLRAGTRMANHLECVRRYAPMFTPSDVPEGTNDLHVWALTFLNSTKQPTGGYILRKSSVQPLHDMAVAYAGSEAEVKRRDLFHYLCFLSSPLRFQPDALEMALAVHDLGYPVHVGMPMVVAGGTGPQTLAGTLTLGNAETLAGWVLSHAFNTETDYGAAAVTMDPRTGIACYADPRRNLLAAAALDFARYYGLPMSGAHLSHTDASAPGIQAAAERVLGALVNAVLGIAPTTIRIGILGASGQTGCLPQMVIDAEICSMLNALFRGIEVDEEHIALELIKQVGIGGTFLDQEHTAAHLRSELWFPALFVREHLNEGGEKVLERAKARVRELLAQPDPHPLPEDKAREIQRILDAGIRAVA